MTKNPLCEGMKEFGRDFRKAEILESNVEVAGYVLTRLNFYMKSLQQEVWYGCSGDRISGIWQILEIFKQLSFEFESGTEFGIELLRNFERDVKELLIPNSVTGQRDPSALEGIITSSPSAAAFDIKMLANADVPYDG